MKQVIKTLLIALVLFGPLSAHAVIPICDPGYVAKCISGCVCSGRGCGGTLHPVYQCVAKGCSAVNGLGYGAASGGTETLFTASSVPYGQTCPSQTFTCNLGVWTPAPATIPTYWNCTVAPPPGGGDDSGGGD